VAHNPRVSGHVGHNPQLAAPAGQTRSDGHTVNVASITTRRRSGPRDPVIPHGLINAQNR